MGYAGLSKLLGIKPGHRIALLNSPEGFWLHVPPDVKSGSSLRSKKEYDVIVLFAKDQAALERRFEVAQSRLVENGGLWIAWPKKSSGVSQVEASNRLDEEVVRAFGLGAGLVDNEVCAIDETWSALRFVMRVEDRKKP